MSRNISQIHEESLLISELKRIRRYKQDAKKQAHDSLKRPSDDDRRSHKKKKRGVYSFDEQRAQHKTATPITTHLRSSLMHKPLAVKQKVGWAARSGWRCLTPVPPATISLPRHPSPPSLPPLVYGVLCSTSA